MKVQARCVERQWLLGKPVFAKRADENGDVEARGVPEEVQATEALPRRRCVLRGPGGRFLIQTRAARALK